jgi:hypothetical protein
MFSSVNGGGDGGGGVREREAEELRKRVTKTVIVSKIRLAFVTYTSRQT